MKKIKIHFVCQGNIYRSRLAEAYAKSLRNKDWGITSSGVNSFRDPRTTLSPWSKIIAEQNNFSDCLSQAKTQTSTDILQKNDIIVFMSQDTYNDARKNYDFNEAISIIWDIKDSKDWNKFLSVDQKRQGTFRQIKRKVDQLVKDVLAGSWVDIVDENNIDLGFSLPITIANRKGLWHRGCHAIITTPAGNTLVQKRSKTIIFSPNLIDITLGGHVDSGENPKQTTIREIKEEIGLHVDAGTLRLLEVHKWDKYHPRYKLFEKVFIYSYHVLLTEDNPLITVQKEEVQSVKILSPTQLRRLIAFHRLRNFGRLNYSYAFYLRIIKLAGVKIEL